MKLGGWLFFAIWFTLFIKLHSMPDSTPAAGPDAGSPAPAATASPPPPEQAPTVAPPTTDITAASPATPPAAPTGTPAATQQPTQESTPSTQPAQTGEELKPTQLKWPDALEIKEEGSEQLKTSDPAIINIYNRSEETLNDCTKITQQLLKDQNDFTSKYTDITNKIDEFFQETTIQKGRILKLKEDINKEDKE
jgi:cell pole-organizing protein PopZ